MVVGGDVPAASAHSRAGRLYLPLGELVLVLLVVVDREYALRPDRLVHLAGHVRVIATGGRDFEPLLGGVVAEGLDDLPGAGETALRQVVAEEVDRRDQGLRLERQ